MDRTTDDDRCYFRRRREQHIAAAQLSADVATSERHQRFAEAYDLRLAALVDED